MENENNTTSTNRNGHPIKRNGYTHFKADQRKKVKQYAADDRQQDYDTLSLTDKIAKATNVRGESKKQLAKLTKLAEKTVNNNNTVKTAVKVKSASHNGGVKPAKAPKN